MEAVWVVVGTTGAWSDRTEWFVCAFDTEAAAQARVTALDAWLRERGMHAGELYRCGASFEDRHGVTCELDPKLEVDYTGARYYCERVPLVTGAAK